MPEIPGAGVAGALASGRPGGAFLKRIWRWDWWGGAGGQGGAGGGSGFRRGGGNGRGSGGHGRGGGGGTRNFGGGGIISPSMDPLGALKKALEWFQDKVDPDRGNPPPRLPHEPIVPGAPTWPGTTKDPFEGRIPRLPADEVPPGWTPPPAGDGRLPPPPFNGPGPKAPYPGGPEIPPYVPRDPKGGMPMQPHGLHWKMMEEWMHPWDYWKRVYEYWYDYNWKNGPPPPQHPGGRDPKNHPTNPTKPPSPPVPPPAPPSGGQLPWYYRIPLFFDLLPPRPNTKPRDPSAPRSYGPFDVA